MKRIHQLICFHIVVKKHKKKASSALSTSSRLSSCKISDIVQRLKLQQYRNSTRRNYYAVWKVFSKFYVRLDHRLMEWSECLTLFVGYLVQKRYQSATVKSYISAIKAVLKEDGVKVTEDQYTLASLVRACKLRNDQIHTRLLIQHSMLSVLLRQINMYFNKVRQLYLGLL